jgi:glycine/D-amino acid oxidase-like deaminating enzyme
MVRALLRRYQPGAAGLLLDSAVCLYTNTPDRHFVIDWHPDHDNVLIVSPCSGHGFKFASAIGEIVADMVTDGVPRFDLSPFALARFAGDAR